MADLSKAPALRLKVDTSQLSTYADMLSQWPKAAQGAIIRAINKTLIKGRSESKKLISAKYNIKQKDVHDAIETERANPTRQSGKLIINPKRRPGLAKFGAKNKFQKQKNVKKVVGVNYTAKKTNGRQYILGAFGEPKSGKPVWVAIPYSIAKLKGKPHPKAGTKSRTDRLMFLQGPSVWGMFASPSNFERVSKVMSNEFTKQLTASVKFEYLVRTGQIQRRMKDGAIVRGKP